MSIDWFTFTAQIINFLILVWLMRRFLYGPIVDAMDQREARIAATHAAAIAAEESGRQRELEYQQKIESLTETREELLAESAREVESWRIEHLRRAKDEVEVARQEWNRTLVREKQTLIRELEQDVARHSTSVSRHVLRQLSDADLQDRIIVVFLRRLSELDKSTRTLLARATDANRPVVIESAAELSADQQQQVAAAVRQHIPDDSDIAFHTNHDLICGIELRVSSCRLGWSIREPLAELEADFIDAINLAIPAMESSAIEPSVPVNADDNIARNPGVRIS